MTDQEWNQEFARSLGVLLSGDAADEIDERGQLIRDSNFVILMNAHHEEIPFALPTRTPNAGWITLVDTSCQTTQKANRFYPAGDSYPLQARSLALLVERRPDQVRADDRRRTQAP
jgi:glycogen operon protein